MNENEARKKEKKTLWMKRENANEDLKKKGEELQQCQKEESGTGKEVAESKHEWDDKVTCSNSCPTVTLSWRRLHHCFDRMVKGTIVRWEDYPN